MSPLPTPQPDSGTEKKPFEHQTVQLSKKQYIQLKWDSRYWQRQHERAAAREHKLKQELELAQAEIRDLKQRLYGKQSEKAALPSESQPDDKKASRPRGQARGSKGHGRTPRPHLPEMEEWHPLAPDQQQCPTCGKPSIVIKKTEDSKIIEVFVKAHVRIIKLTSAIPSCQCPGLPKLMTAPPAPRLIPKSSLGVSIWVEVLLGKYLYATPTHRLS